MDDDEAFDFRREHCPTCASRRDDDGRMPIGHCGPDCLARIARDRAAELARQNAPSEIHVLASLRKWKARRG